MELNRHVASYISLMTSMMSWYGSDDPTNRTITRYLIIFYTRIKWLINILITVAVAVSLYNAEAYGLYDGTLLFFPLSLVISILLIIPTFVGGKQERLALRFNHFMTIHNEPWMQSIQDRYANGFLKFINICILYMEVVLTFYLVVPCVVSVILHYGFGYLKSPFCLPGHFSAFLGQEVKWEFSYFLITVLNGCVMVDLVYTILSYMTSYPMLTAFFLSELEIFENNLKYLNSVDYIEQEQVDIHFRQIVQFHSDIVQLNYDVKQYFGLPGAFISVITSVSLPLFSFTIYTSANPAVRFLYCFGFITYFTLGLVYCLVGQLVENKSDDIFRAVYKLRWYELSPHVRKSLNMILRQARAPLTLDYHGTFVMNFNNFKQILRSSYSYFTLLQSMTRTS